jgi:hypothetical protein
MPDDDEALTLDQQLAVVANTGGDLIAASFAYAAACETMNLAGVLAGSYS